MGLEALSGERAASSACLDNLRDNILELAAEEAGDDGGRRFVRAEPVIIADICRGETQEVGVRIHGCEHTGERQEKQLILVRALAGV